MAKKKKADPITPEAPCLWPFLNKPIAHTDDDGNRGKPMYKVNLTFDQDDEFIQKIRTAAEKAFQKETKNLKPAEKKKAELFDPVKEVLDDEGNPTGTVRLEFKTYAVFKDKKTGEDREIRLNAFDAGGNQMKRIPRIGNGSILSVAFNPVSRMIKDRSGHVVYYTLYLNAFQLIELVEYQRDGSSFGFGKKDGGYVADEDDDNPFDEEGSEGDFGDEDDDVPF